MTTQPPSRVWLDADDSPDASDDLAGVVQSDGDVNVPALTESDYAVDVLLSILAAIDEEIREDQDDMLFILNEYALGMKDEMRIRLMGRRQGLRWAKEIVQHQLPPKARPAPGILARMVADMERGQADTSEPRS